MHQMDFEKALPPHLFAWRTARGADNPGKTMPCIDVAAARLIGKGGGLGCLMQQKRPGTSFPTASRRLEFRDGNLEFT